MGPSKASTEDILKMAREAGPASDAGRRRPPLRPQEHQLEALPLDDPEFVRREEELEERYDDDEEYPYELFVAYWNAS